MFWSWCQEVGNFLHKERWWVWSRCQFEEAIIMGSDICMVADYLTNLLKWIGFSGYTSLKKWSWNDTFVQCTLKFSVCCMGRIFKWRKAMGLSFFSIVFFWTSYLKKKCDFFFFLLEFYLLSSETVSWIIVTLRGQQWKECLQVNRSMTLQCVLYFMLAECVGIHHLYLFNIWISVV